MSIYLEKDIFKINGFIPSLIQGSTNFFYQLSPIAIIKTLPPIAFFNSVIENADIINILVNIPRLFLQSIHGINRAFNSEKYDNLYTTHRSLKFLGSDL